MSSTFNIDWTPALQIAAQMQWDLVEDGKLTAFAEALAARIKDRGYYSTYGIAKRMGDKVLESVISRFDATRSNKNSARQTGRLRASIRRLGPFMDNSGDVTVLIGGQLPKYWAFQEYGIKPTTRKQEYMVVGVNVGGGKAQHNVTFTTTQDTANIANSYMTMPASKDSGQRKAEIQSFFGKKKIKLVSKKASYLSRIKNKVTIEFEHPGIQPRKFFAAGLGWLEANGSQYFAQEFKEVMARANFDANYKTLKILR
jgi:hypothetical protein